jgi:hypothetical protein
LICSKSHAGGYWYQELLQVSGYSFLDPAASYPLPSHFDFPAYIETENEFWALFPETHGMRVNFCQLGLTAQIYVESRSSTGELAHDETYFLMPCEDYTMRPLRMRALRRLTLLEYRMSHLTALRLRDYLETAGPVMDQVHMQIMGPEILRDSA